MVAVIALVGVVVAVAVRVVPRRSLPFAFTPALFLIAACIVGKGWPNHVQQVLCAVVPLQLLVLSQIWNTRADGPRWRPAHGLVAAAMLLFVAYRTNQTLLEAWYYKSPFPQAIDGDILDARKVAAFLKEHTGPDDR